PAANDFAAASGSSAPRIHARGVETALRPGVFNSYLTVTLAPASSNFFLAVSESALLAPSSTGLGAPSTRALASAKPSPAFTSRTTLITAIFLSAGTDSRITSKVSLASAAGAAGPPTVATGAATAIGAAAVTPQAASSFFTSSAVSSTVKLLS